MKLLTECLSALVLVLALSVLVMAGALIGGFGWNPLQCIGIAVILVAAVCLFAAMAKMVFRDEFNRYLEEWKKITRG